MQTTEEETDVNEDQTEVFVDLQIPIPLAGTEIKKGCALASPRNIRPWRGHYFYVNHSDQRNIHEVGF